MYTDRLARHVDGPAAASAVRGVQSSYRGLTNNVRSGSPKKKDQDHGEMPRGGCRDAQGGGRREEGGRERLKGEGDMHERPGGCRAFGWSAQAWAARTQSVATFVQTLPLRWLASTASMIAFARQPSSNEANIGERSAIGFPSAMCSYTARRMLRNASGQASW